MHENQAAYEFIFLRHAESEGNRSGVIQGQTEYSLSEKGRLQTEALAKRWLSERRRFDAIVSSPLLRARETAEIIAAALTLEIEYDPIWMERDFGQIAGVSRASYWESLGHEFFLDPYTPLGETGETPLSFFLRGGQALQSLMTRPAGAYLVVAHGGILNMSLYAALGIAPQPNFQGPQFEFRNAGFATLTYQPSEHRWRIMGLNDQAHWTQPR